MNTESESKTVYALVNITAGVSSQSLSTTSFREAQKEYHSTYRSCGVTPRVFMDGRKLTIVEGDKLFGLEGANKWRGKNSPEKTGDKKLKFIDQHQNIAAEKARKAHKRIARGGQL